MKAKRKNIPEAVKIQVWTEAAGRCQRKGCNKVLWYNSFTLADGNFSEYAHIIGANIDGPRGNNESEKLQDKPENLMLLCKECHHEIDLPKNIAKYPMELLLKWKKDHEERIRIQTSIQDDNYKTTIIRFTSRIGKRLFNITDEQVYAAINPKYPSDRRGIVISKDDFDRNKDSKYWEYIAQEISDEIQRKLYLGIDGNPIGHISIFGVAAQPLLMVLGKNLPDTLPVDIYHANRSIENPNKTWVWDKADETISEYQIKCESKNGNEDVAIVLALSDNIEQDKYKNAIDDNFTIYKLFIENPSPLFLKNKQQIENFSYEFRKLLNNIQKEHGKNTKIHLFPAIPASIAIQIGRLLIPTKDPEICVYEFFSDEGMRKVIKLL